MISTRWTEVDIKFLQTIWHTFPVPNLLSLPCFAKDSLSLSWMMIVSVRFRVIGAENYIPSISKSIRRPVYKHSLTRILEIWQRRPKTRNLKLSTTRYLHLQSQLQHHHHHQRHSLFFLMTVCSIIFFGQTKTLLLAYFKELTEDLFLGEYYYFHLFTSYTVSLYWPN